MNLIIIKLIIFDGISHIGSEPLTNIFLKFILYAYSRLGKVK